MYKQRTDTQTIIARGRKAAVVIVVVSLLSIAGNIAGFIKYL